MHLIARSPRRGQTFPFWVFTIILALTLVFFVANYTNTMRWELRAQNAADSAAAAAISTDANQYNELTTMMYAAAVEENRIRYLTQAIVNTINGVGGCDPSPGGSCDQDYSALTSAYQTAVTNYQSLVQLMRQANNFTQGGQKNGPWKAVALLGSNCTVFDCAFALTTLDAQTGGPGTPELVDVAACRNVPTLVPVLLGLGTGNTFQAIGRSAQTLNTVAETFEPEEDNPLTGAPYQPDEAQWVPFPFPAYTVGFDELEVSVTWEVAGPTEPYAAYPTGGVACT